MALIVFSGNIAYAQQLDYTNTAPVSQLPQLDYQLDQSSPDLPPQQSYDNYYQGYDANGNKDNQIYRDYNNNSQGALGQNVAPPSYNHQQQPYTQQSHDQQLHAQQPYAQQPYPNNNYTGSYPQYYQSYSNNYQYQPQPYQYQYKQPKDYSGITRRLKSAALYGAMGGATGALTSSKHRGRNAGIGAGIGAVLGLLLGR